MMNLALKEHRLAPPQNAALRDYDSVRRAVAFISEHWRSQPTIEKMADAAGITVDELHLLFRRWAAQTPKTFLHAVTLLRFLDDCRESDTHRIDRPGSNS
jgi:AraC family transcriptional regulator of adaptative response/methylated-DNA-[protein]-cysteine methyltransferase